MKWDMSALSKVSEIKGAKTVTASTVVERTDDESMIERIVRSAKTTSGGLFHACLGAAALNSQTGMLGLVGRMVEKAKEKERIQDATIAERAVKKLAAQKVLDDSDDKPIATWKVPEVKAVVAYKISALRREDWPAGVDKFVGSQGGLPAARDKLLSLSALLQEIELSAIRERVPPVIPVLDGYPLPMIEELIARIKRSPTIANAGSVSLEVARPSAASPMSVDELLDGLSDSLYGASPPAVSPSAPAVLAAVATSPAL
jgi:hypothetical protein